MSPLWRGADSESDDDMDSEDEAAARIHANARMVAACGRPLQQGAWKGCAKSAWWVKHRVHLAEARMGPVPSSKAYIVGFCYNAFLRSVVGLWRFWRLYPYVKSGCITSLDVLCRCDREDRHRGLCNHKASIPGPAACPVPDVTPCSSNQHQDTGVCNKGLCMQSTYMLLECVSEGC